MLLIASPSTLNLLPYTLHLLTLHLKPYTLHLTPSTFLPPPTLTFHKQHYVFEYGRKTNAVTSHYSPWFIRIECSIVARWQ